jgi:hypothetical protein
VKPISVNRAVPECTRGLAPSAVRMRPYTSQGWRPSSAVIQPVVVAMYGNGNASISVQSIGRERASVPRSRQSAATPMTRMNSVPRPAMM